MDRIEINVQTGEQTLIQLTADEVAAANARQEECEAQAIRDGILAEIEALNATFASTLSMRAVLGDVTAQQEIADTLAQIELLKQQLT